MKTMFRTLLMALLVLAPTAVSAQKSSDPEGYVTYSLPSTTLVLDVEAVQECFYAGPYAKFAEKYLGIKVRQKDETKWQIAKVGLTSAVEADLNRRYTLALKKNAPDLSFLKLSSAGLVAFADGGVGEGQTWNFPVQGSADFAAKGVSSNLKSEATTLYRSERKEDVYNKVSVQQNMLVEKSLEQKAAEAAQKIVRRWGLQSQSLHVSSRSTCPFSSDIQSIRQRTSASRLFLMLRGKARCMWLSESQTLRVLCLRTIFPEDLS